MTKRCFLGGAILAFMLLVVSLDTWALPPFARKYQTSCITCHEAFPRFNAVGEAFRLNGFKFTDDELLIKQEPLELGDEAHKRLWPASIWPNNITQVPPLSVAMKWIAAYQTDRQPNPVTGDKPPPVSFVLPHEVEIAWPGTLGKDISFYGDLIFTQEDYGTSEFRTWAMLKAWVEFEDLFGMENLLNFRLGTVGTHSMGLVTARDEQTLSIQTYNFNGWTMPDLLRDEHDLVAEFSEIKNFGGNKFEIAPQTGIELNGFGKNWLYYAGVVTGNVKNTGSSSPEEADIFFVGAGTNTSKKDYYMGLAYKLGGISFEGPQLKDDIDSPDDQKAKAEDKILKPSQTEFWHDDSVTFSFFGYKGSALIKASTWDTEKHTITGPHTVYTADDDFWRIGAGIMSKYKDFTLNLGYMFGRDDDPYGILSDVSVDSQAWFAEVFYFAYPWLIAYGRYEGLDFDGLPKDLLLDTEQDREILTLGCKSYIRANISLQIEGTYYPKEAGHTYPLNKTIFLMLNTTF